MKRFFIGLSSIFILSGCIVEFKAPPFLESELISINATEIGKDIIRIGQAGTIRNEILQKWYQSFRDFGDKKVVFKVNEELLIVQEKEKNGNVTLTVIMKNLSHVMACQILEVPEEIDDSSVSQNKRDEGMYKVQEYAGSQEELRKFAIQLSKTATKFCAAFPYIESDRLEPWDKFMREIKQHLSH